MTFGSFLRTHAKNIRAAKAEKANGQAIHQIDKDIEGEAQLNIYHRRAVATIFATNVR